jgi:hypothetical protein
MLCKKPIEIADAAIARLNRIEIAPLNRRITNEVFLTIQNNRELMYQYLRAVEEFGLDTVNQQIGKEIKQIFE